MNGTISANLVTYRRGGLCNGGGGRGGRASVPGTGSERLITSLGHLIRGAIDNMACFSRSGGEGGRSH